MMEKWWNNAYEKTLMVENGKSVITQWLSEKQGTAILIYVFFCVLVNNAEAYL